MTTCDDGTQSPVSGQVTSFVQIDSAYLYSGLDSDALHLYLILLDKSWKLGCCWPTDRTIGEWMGGKSCRTMNRLFKKLEAAGLVTRTVVPVTGENQSGRLITVNGRVRPPAKSVAGGATKRGRPPATKTSHSSNTKEEKKYGPPTPGTGAAPEQTIEERIAEARRTLETATSGPMARWPRFREVALQELAALEAEAAARSLGETA